MNPSMQYLVRELYRSMSDLKLQDCMIFGNWVRRIQGTRELQYCKRCGLSLCDSHMREHDCQLYNDKIPCVVAGQNLRRKLSDEYCIDDVETYNPRIR